MAKGHYKKEFGGSKSGYQKGVRDTLKVVGVILLSLTSIVTTVLVSKNKK